MKTTSIIASAVLLSFLSAVPAVAGEAKKIRAPQAEQTQVAAAPGERGWTSRKSDVSRRLFWIMVARR
jgi:hypothetical protein